jgi:hypothetical protein
MLFVKHAEYQRRLAICKTCKFFEATTQSCGPLIVGDEEEIEVNFRKKSIRLCGCIMPVKAKLSFASCPASKWDGTLTEKEQIEFKRFILDMQAKGRLEDKDLTTFYNFKDKATNSRGERTTCSACVRKDIQTFLKSMEHIIVD